MNTTFNNLVDMVRDLSLPEKIEIKTVLKKSIIEEKRDKIHRNYLNAKKAYTENKLEFSNDISKLKKLMES